MAKTMTRMMIAAIAALLVAAATPARAEPKSTAGSPTVVVELFTSQGCSSCPPADAYLGELATQPGILALSMHVDYWNGLGWKDPFSSAVVTDRQRNYARSLSGRYVYTPQMVVMGRGHAVGSNRADVARLIAQARASMPPAPAIAIRHPARNTLTVHIGAQPYAGQATVWLVAYDTRHTTTVAAGENGGRTLANSHVVRGIRSIGQWGGSAAEYTVDVAEEMRDGYENCAVIVQAGGTGPIIGAASAPMAMAAR